MTITPRREPTAVLQHRWESVTWWALGEPDRDGWVEAAVLTARHDTGVGYRADLERGHRQTAQPARQIVEYVARVRQRANRIHRCPQ